MPEKTSWVRAQSLLKKLGVTQAVDPDLLDQAQVFTVDLVQAMINTAHPAPNGLVVGPRVESEHLFDVPQFLDLMFAEWENYKVQGLPLLGEAEISTRYPHVNINENKKVRIVSSILHRKPGGLSADTDPNNTVSKVTAYKPIYRGQAKDPEFPGYSILYFQYLFDNWILLSLGSDSPNDTEAWSLVFEDFLLANRWKWIRAGALDFRYMGMTAANQNQAFEVVTQTKLTYAISINLYLRTQRVLKVLERDIERFHLSLVFSNLNG